MFPKQKRLVDQTAIERVRVRDPYCQVCGQRRTDIHHITSRGSGGADEDSNLIGLCRICHNKTHSGEIPRAQLRRILAEKYAYEYEEWELTDGGTKFDR